MVNALKKLGVFKGELAERLRQAKDLNEVRIGVGVVLGVQI